MHRTATDETTLISEILNIINEEIVIIEPGQGKTPVSILCDEFCEERAFHYLLRKGKCDYSLSPALYFNQSLLNINQYFASDVDYVFFPGLCMSSIT